MICMALFFSSGSNGVSECKRIDYSTHIKLIHVLSVPTVRAQPTDPTQQYRVFVFARALARATVRAPAAQARRHFGDVRGQRHLRADWSGGVPRGHGAHDHLSYGKAVCIVRGSFLLQKHAMWMLLAAGLPRAGESRSPRLDLPIRSSRVCVYAISEILVAGVGFALDEVVPTPALSPHFAHRESTFGDENSTMCLSVESTRYRGG